MKTADRAVSMIKNSIVDKRVLEVACGCAEFSLAASKFAAAVECIDLDDAKLLPAAAQGGKVAFSRMDATKMDYASGLFDTVVIYNALGHLSACFDHVLKECDRVVKKSGQICILSSWKLDKSFITGQLLPELKQKGRKYLLTEGGDFLCVALEGDAGIRPN